MSTKKIIILLFLSIFLISCTGLGVMPKKNNKPRLRFICGQHDIETNALIGEEEIFCSLFQNIGSNTVLFLEGAHNEPLTVKERDEYFKPGFIPECLDEHLKTHSYDMRSDVERDICKGIEKIRQIIDKYYPSTLKSIRKSKINIQTLLELPIPIEGLRNKLTVEELKIFTNYCDAVNKFDIVLLSKMILSYLEGNDVSGAMGFVHGFRLHSLARNMGYPIEDISLEIAIEQNLGDAYFNYKYHITALQAVYGSEFGFPKDILLGLNEDQRIEIKRVFKF